jgi:membrane-bound inhibitor of C-type lysozyme
MKAQRLVPLLVGPDAFALLCVAAYSLASCAAPAAKPSADHSIAASFECSGGKRIQAVFATGSEPSVKLSLSDGREMVLPQVIAASGARYANRDESFVFWNKGRTAFVEEAGRQTFTECVQAP